MENQPAPLEQKPDENGQGGSREAQPVDTEQPPCLPFAVVGIGASAGGLEAVSEFLSAVRADSGMAYIFLQHLPPTGESLLPEILSKRVSIPVHEIDDQMSIEANHLYCARPGRTSTITDGKFHLGAELGRPMHNRPVDDLFKSLAQEQRERAVAIILSGMGSNGTAGARAIKAVGGLCIAQEPETAQFPSMPRHLVDAGYADYILRPADMPDVLLAYAGHPYARGSREEKAELAKRDQQHLREILAILRTRARQDFNGYKKPTVLRRVQRRMGINRLTKLGEYSKFLRQTPMEVSALSDDLLIHVTGFFRDPDAWEALRKEVIVPLVASRETNATVRCWVTACSSGEEAYSLAILLVEESERINKSLDIKVFATDMADRTLKNARGGIYPGGIEAEIEPSRLERFFQKEDAVYRVRQDLRERVVFAPQNLLHDPPFSRLDIATCRNLLIYLEPNMQQRILSLLHFGLREGGTLFLGSSETASGDDLFQIINKKARIFRRVGPTRHASVDFPLPHVLVNSNRDETASGDRRMSTPRASIAQLTARALLEQHTPAAVTIDRDYHIVFFHGDVDPFVTSPRGEPTRNLMELARESVRGAVRTAVHRAMSTNTTVMVRDGWLETGAGQRVRIEIVASPLERKEHSDFYVVSFQERTEYKPEGDGEREATDRRDSAEELRRARDELQSTIEELQTSNEELKASNEEVVSTNEELQSSNEELETSREEMQSLNEELSTVNSQLHAKMEEHQASSNDLASLLSSTDIAVLFLDASLRIRRFTAAMRRLMDLIPSDSGRPINDMARKFTDPDLLRDAQSVSDNLVPIEREIEAEDHRWYLRRVLPYRTIDNHIDGLVVTFVDVSERRRAEDALRLSESRLRAIIEQTPLAMAFISPTGEILFRNPWFDQLWGRGAHDITAEAYSKVYEGYHLDGRPVESEEWPGARAVLKGETVEDELYEIVQADGHRITCWFAAAPIRDTSGAVAGGVVLFRDVSEEQRMQNSIRRSEQQQAFLLKLSDSIRPLDNPLEIQQVAMRLLGEHLNVTRAFYFLTEPVEDGDWYHIIETEYRRDPATQPSFVGRHSVRAFSDTLFEGLHLGKVIKIKDITTAKLTTAQREKFKAIDVVAVVNVPLIKGRDVVAGITVHDAVPREWRAVDIDIMRELAARVETAVERTRAEIALRESGRALAQAKRRIEAALLAGEMATFWWDTASDRLTGDRNFAGIIGRSVDETSTVPMSDFLELIHPQDLVRVRSAIDATVKENSPFYVEFRLASRKSAPPAQKSDGQSPALEPQSHGLSSDSHKDSETNGSGPCSNGSDSDTRREAGTVAFPGSSGQAASGDSGNFALQLADEAEPDGDYRWFVSRGTVDRDAAGKSTIWVGALVDITNRKQSEEFQRRLRAVAEDANRLKDEFLATLSHELRTPLGAILLWTQILLEQSQTSPFAGELNSILSSARAQQTLIEDLLDMSRITNGTLRLQIRDIDLSDTLRQSVSEISESARAKGIDLELNLDDRIGLVQADPDRIRQVVWNLLSNAVKFTPTGGQIQVRAWRPNGHVEIEIKDSGKGIAPDFLPHIFERFRQGDATQSRSVGGLGLGLAIAKQLVDLHGGSIEAQSDGADRGATFNVRLPMPEVTNENRPDNAASNGGPGNADSVTALIGLMVLLVEDNKQTRDAITALLTRAGLRVLTAENAEAALNIARESNPDLIVSDIGLPGGDGNGLIQKIRLYETEQNLETTPALALTAFAGEANRRKAIEAGFQQYLTKPIDPAQILAALAALAKGPAASSAPGTP